MKRRNKSVIFHPVRGIQFMVVNFVENLVSDMSKLISKIPRDDLGTVFRGEP